MSKRKTLPASKQRQKVISTDLIRLIMNKQKQLQLAENTRHGRKARTISFVYASHMLARGNN